MTRSRGVFLDRDGVLNRACVVDGVPHPPASLIELVILPGVIESCSRLRMAGFKLIMVTNQPDIARRSQTRRVVDQINEAICVQVGLDDVRVCPHDSPDDCQCRKPRPGMLLDAARGHDIDLQASFMVGDRDGDIAAGRAAGCRTVFVDHQYTAEPPPDADLIVNSLYDAVDWIIATPPSARRTRDVSPEH
jgi:D-glycero-D-manno-heptose 1,7-bisphosphate phosphatase